MKDVAIVAAAGLIAYLVFSRLPVRQTTVVTQAPGASRLEIPQVFASGGGWMPSGAYDPALLDNQMAAGWGYGD